MTTVTDKELDNASQVLYGTDNQKKGQRMETYRPIRTASDITPELLEMVEVIYDGWFIDEVRIDWHAFLDRLELMGLYDLGGAMDSEAIKVIKKHVRKIKADS